MNIPDWLLLLVAILACYRISALVTLDDGPFDVFIWVRAFWGRLAARNLSRLVKLLAKTVADLVHCQYCLGVWVAGALAVILFGTNLYTLVWWLAIAGGQSFLADVVNLRGHHE